MLVLTLFAGCGGGGDAQTPSLTTGNKEAEPSATTKQKHAPHVWVTLDGRAGAENVGILMAEKRGFFTSLGYSVASGAPARPRRPVMYVSDRTADIGVSQQPQLVVSKEKRAPVIAVGSLLSQPTLSMIWLRRSHIQGIGGLKGKTIGVPGIPYQERFLEFVLAKAGLTSRDVHVKIVSYNLLRALEEGHVDAIFGGSWNLEGAVLKERGLRPVIVPVRRLGIPTYEELVVIARTRRAARSPRLMQRFMTAVARGTAAAIANPEAAVRVIEKNYEKGYDLSHDDIKAEVEATLPLLSRTGYMNKARTRALVGWMQGEGLIQRPLGVPALITDRYLPKAAGS
jgi:putative hydroxymethylpyrimidine transport system substrate-binding protein